MRDLNLGNHNDIRRTSSNNTFVGNLGSGYSSGSFLWFSLLI
jgi:hypothetical protein